MPPGLAPDPAARDHGTAVARLRRLAGLLDSRFRIPGTAWRFGLDGAIGLIPGVGDVATALLAAYIVLEARRLRVRKRTLARMLWNVAVDALLGSIPVLGDVFDIAFKANRKNIDLILRDLSARERRQPSR